MNRSKTYLFIASGAVILAASFAFLGLVKIPGPPAEPSPVYTAPEEPFQQQVTISFTAGRLEGFGSFQVPSRKRLVIEHVSARVVLPDGQKIIQARIETLQAGGGAMASHYLTTHVVSLVPFSFNLVGLVPLAFGAMLNIWADQFFKKRTTTVKPFERPTVFIIEGPFAWSRHPMYLGMVAILLGMSLICGSLTSFVGPIVFWVIVRVRFISAEEQSMTDVFGEQYNDYKSRVRSWI